MSASPSDASSLTALTTPSIEEIQLAAQTIGDTHRQIDLSVPDIRCGACINTIERTLSAIDGVVRVRANLTTRQVRVVWDAALETPPLIETLAAAGFSATVQDAPSGETHDRTLSQHLKALAVAGFAAGNIMLLSVSVWSGADNDTRALFHGLSAAIALPALAYAGQIFYRSAWQALRHGRVNMDVPISIGILLAAALSVYDTLTHGEQVYFDAATMLVFFLLIGRTLDQQMRAKARHAADALTRLEPRGAHVLQPDGTTRFRSLAAIAAGDRLLLAAGGRAPVDCRVEVGCSTVDRALVTGESAPVSVTAGAELQAGILNITAPLTVIASADAQHSFLAEIRRLMQNAEVTRGRYRRIADRAASLYAPVVHAAAALSLAAWYWTTGDLHQAITVGVAVLIITCPCALGLAVPIVQVVAARRLFDRGVLTKDGAALERLADIDTVVFDKTGTLTTGRAHLLPDAQRHKTALSLAQSLAHHSDHPHARALADASVRQGDAPGDHAEPVYDTINEVAGAGVEGRSGRDVYRLGRADWAAFTNSGEDLGTDTEPVSADVLVGNVTTGVSMAGASEAAPDPVSKTVLSINGVITASFSFRDSLRPDAHACIDTLRRQVPLIELLSGDDVQPVKRAAADLGITRVRAQVPPVGKTAHVQQLARQGHAVLMVGDGLNDSPALAAASVSIAPGSAADVGRKTADFILLHDNLMAIPYAVAIARRAHQLVRQNLALAVLYNLCAMPLAIAGVVTPLLAAVSMSLSSIVVIANALRLARTNAFERAMMPSPVQDAAESVSSMTEQAARTSPVRSTS